jgi:hypothetical protein
MASFRKANAVSSFQQPGVGLACSCWSEARFAVQRGRGQSGPQRRLDRVHQFLHFCLEESTLITLYLPIVRNWLEQFNLTPLK